LISLVPLLTYIGIFIFVVGCIMKFYTFGNTPIHLRWELYPVAHERSKPYGGSYFEEFNWWTHKREKSKIGEILTMGEEILLLKVVFEHNRKMWYYSYPFHIGLYLLVMFIISLVLGSFCIIIELPVQIIELFNSVTVLSGVLGLVLTFAGSAGLLMRRLFSRDLKGYSTPQDYFNLLLILTITFTAFSGWIITDNFFSTIGGYVKGIMTFAPTESIDGISSWIISSIIFFSFYLAYFPFTNMTHPIGKYFMYHKVRWNDEPNIVGGKFVKKIEKVLNYKVSWSAPHIKGEGKKTWKDVATEEVDFDEKK
jgi:nitrate reductase gamma subunit